MFLAKKRIAIARKEDRQEGRAEIRSELELIIRDPQERIRSLENGGSQRPPTCESAP